MIAFRRGKLSPASSPRLTVLVRDGSARYQSTIHSHWYHWLPHVMVQLRRLVHVRSPWSAGKSPCAGAPAHEVEFSPRLTFAHSIAPGALRPSSFILAPGIFYSTQQRERPASELLASPPPLTGSSFQSVRLAALHEYLTLHLVVERNVGISCYAASCMLCCMAWN